MRNYSWLLLALVLPVTFGACSGEDSPSKSATPITEKKKHQRIRSSYDPDPGNLAPKSTATRDGNIYFESELNEKERGAIVTALDRLRKEELLEADSRLRKIMRLRRLDSTSVRAWIEERVQYIVFDSLPQDKLVVVSRSHAFDNPGIFPSAFQKVGKNGQEGLSLVMANPGALSYLLGKKHGQLDGLQADGIGLIPFTSPRAGIIATAMGLLSVVNPELPNAVRGFQLSTLLHEARHSDGNGKSAGFLHARCPSDHDFAGKYVCDQSRNGPYTIDYLVTRAIRKACRGCSAAEKETLGTLETQARLRVLDDAVDWDDTPEGRRQ
jgi:hypothetical protein